MASSLSSTAFKRLTRELLQLQASPPEGIRVVLDEHDMLQVVGWIEGPQGTPFEGGYFKIRFQFGSDFPNQPPKCTFATKIFHPNVAPGTGEICVSTLKKDWKKEYGVGHILITVKCLLIHPNPESALHEEAGKLLLEAYDDYARHARLMTDVHARHRPAEFTTTTSSSSYSPYPASTSSSAASTSKSASQTAPLRFTSTSATSSNTAQDVNMQEAGSSTSSAEGKASGSLPSVIPKKRPAPPVSANTTMPPVMPSAAAINSLFASVPSAAQQGVLGASSLPGGGNAMLGKKPAGNATAGSTQAKKRGLKRL